MIKRLISLILSLCLMVSAVDVKVFADETGSEVPKEITLSMYSNLCTDTSISGLYADNVFYIPLEKLCDIVNCKIVSQSDKEATIEVAIRSFILTVGSGNMIEKMNHGNNNIKMPSMYVDGQIYISALHFLTYIGAVVEINENVSPQLIVVKRYDLFDALVEMVDMDSGHFFWWDEFDIEFEDLKNKIVNAGLVALINRDSNVFRMMFDAKGMERDAVEKALLTIVKNEAADYFDNPDVESERIDNLSKSIGVVSDWIDLVTEAYNDVPELSDQINKLVGEVGDGSGGVSASVTFVTNVYQAIESLKQFDNVQATQKDLLANTILKYTADSRTLNDQWKVVIEAAERIDDKIQSEYAKQIDFATQTAESAAFDFINNVATAAPNPVAVAWDSAILLTKFIPESEEMIDRKDKLYNAYNCSMIQLIANEMLVEAYSDWYYGDFSEPNSTSRSSNPSTKLNDIKQLMILQLKSTLTTREYLIESGFVEEYYANQMKEMNTNIAILLNKTEGCYVPKPNMFNVEYDGDLTWMADMQAYEPGTDEYKTNAEDVQFLAYKPYEDHKSLVDIYEYNITGGIYEKNGGYGTYTLPPTNLACITIPNAFTSNGYYESLTVDIREAREKKDEYIAFKYGMTDASGSHTNYIIGTGAGQNWNGESRFCYIYHGEHADYMVLESFAPTSVHVRNGIYEIGPDDGSVTEYISIDNLNDYSMLGYKITRKNGEFTIEEEIKTPEDTFSYSTKIYYENGYSNNQSLYGSYGEAINHIIAELEKIGLDSRIVGGRNVSINDLDITPIYIEHRPGIKQDIPLDTIHDVVLQDRLYWGVNSQYVFAGGEDVGLFEPESVIGVWDSADGYYRYIFQSTGNDFTVTYEGIEFANGTIQILNFISGERDYADYIFDGDKIIIVRDLVKHNFAFSLDGDLMQIGDDYFYRVKNSVVKKLIGTWENDELEMEFKSVYEVVFRDKTGYRNDRRGVMLFWMIYQFG